MSIASSKRKLSEESKKKISKANTGKRRTEQVRLKMSISRKGQKRSKEFCENRKINRKSFVYTEACVKAISLGLKGKKCSENFKKNVSNFMKGKRRSKDKSLYKFYNKSKREEFYGTRVQFCIKYDLDIDRLGNYIMRNVKRKKRLDLDFYGWNIILLDEVLVDSYIKKFKNVYTNEEFVGTIKDFSNKFGLDKSRIHRLINYKIKKYLGWTYVKQ